MLTALLLVALAVPSAAFAHQHGGDDGDDAMADDNGYGDDDGDASEERPLLWDVPEGFVHEPGIRWAAEQGITVAFEDNSFRPSDSVTRAQTASFLARALDLEESEETFSDVPADFVHAGAISAVAAAEITVGFPDGTFRPAQPIRRDQMASFLARALELEPGDETFEDVPEGSEHAEAISAITAAEITVGCAEGLFCPGDPVTRGQMATFLFRALADEPTDPPVDPELPETPETPVVPEQPETPEPPVGPEDPDTPETPVLPELPETPETPIAVGDTALGEVVVDAEGMTLYIFDNDVPGSGVSACTGGCADNWPPLLVEGTPQVGEGLDEDLLGAILRDDGTVQVTYNGWPLYGWVNDNDPGDTTGQGFNDVWWVMAPDGTPQREG